MTRQQVQLIKRSWRLFQQIKPELVGDVFYSKLFADMPSLRKMFPDDMQPQYNKLVDMLSTLVSRIDQPLVLTEEIAAMARRHAGYGVRPVHYKVAGRALVWTLEKGLGGHWNADICEAWTTYYERLAHTMITTTANCLFYPEVT